MKIRPHDQFGGHEGGPHLRYVQQYATDADPDQPVQVKLLTWDGSAFITYGTEFRIGDADTADQISSGENFWIAWRRDAKRWYPISGGNEKFRLIRGQSVGVQSGATVLIDNVDVLAGGLDPTNGNPATQVTVQNLFGQTFSDNEAVQAIYNEGLGGTDLTDWEAIKTTSGTETYRAIRGIAVGDISPGAATFTIDNVIALAGGLDPSGGNPATPITVQNVQGEAFADNEPITAIYDGAAWEVLLTERYRLIQGNAVASVAAEDVSFSIDGVVPLADGLDPVLGNPATTVLVFKHQSESLQLAEPVVAAWNGSFWDLLTVERRRIVRGQVVGSVSAGAPDFQIDNIDVLGSGVDPRLDPTDAAELLDVANFHGDFYEDDEWITAAFNEAVGGPGIDWEALKKPTNEKFRLIRGLVKGAVTADDATFVIDNVIPLGSGNDPVSGNPATEITVSNTHRALSGTAGETLRDNTPVTAIWTGAIWELLLVERYRLIKGKATAESSAGAGTFSIDEVDVLAGSVDPRTDPTSEIETVTVTKTWPDKYKNNADIIAAHNPRTGAWDVISRGLTMEGLTINLDIVAGPPKKLRVELLLDGEVISFDEVTFSTKIINNPTAAGLNLDADSLDLEIAYTPVTFYELVAPEDGVSDDFTDTVVVDDCTP